MAKKKKPAAAPPANPASLPPEVAQAGRDLLASFGVAVRESTWLESVNGKVPLRADAEPWQVAYRYLSILANELSDAALSRYAATTPAPTPAQADLFSPAGPAQPTQADLTELDATQ